MQQTNFKLLVDSLTQIAVFYGGYWAILKAVKEYFQTRIAEADKKSQAGMIKLILSEIDELKDCQQKGTYSENEMKLLINRLIEDLKFLMQQLFESNIPKRNIKKLSEDLN